MEANSGHLMSVLEHKMLLEDISSSATHIEDQLKYIVCGQSTADELENLFGLPYRREKRAEVRLHCWRFAYAGRGLGYSDPQVLTVVISEKGCVTDFALV
jgi:hypothetical protein